MFLATQKIFCLPLPDLEHCVMLSDCPVNMRQWSVVLVPSLVGLMALMESDLSPCSIWRWAGLHQNSTSGRMKLVD